MHFPAERGHGAGQSIRSTVPVTWSTGCRYGLSASDLIIAGEPTLGVIVIPPLDELFWAVKGAGALARRPETSCPGRGEFSRSRQRLRLDERGFAPVDPRSLPGRLRDLGSACCEQSFVAANRLQASIFLGEHEHDVAAGIVITSEAGCEFGNLAGERLTPSEMIRRTPIKTPTFIAAPRRPAALTRTLARSLYRTGPDTKNSVTSN